MTEKLNVIYFISDGEYIKIGKADDLEARLIKFQTDNPRPIEILATIQVIDTPTIFEEERLAHDYFQQYRVKGEWFKKDILPLIPNYVKTRGGEILKETVKLLNRKQTIIGTLEGPKPINFFRPKCYFFPHLPAQIKGRAGPGETYRTISWQGKRVYVSGRFWKIYSEIKQGY